MNGLVFKKTFSYAGFEQQPKKFLNPKILLLTLNYNWNLRRKMQRSGICTDSLKAHLLQNRMCAPFFTYVALYAFQCLLILAPCFQHTCRLSDPLQYQSIIDAKWTLFMINWINVWNRVFLVFLLGILYLLQKRMVYHKILNTLHGHGCGCLCPGQARVSNSADLLGIRHDAKYHLESKMGVGV